MVLVLLLKDLSISSTTASHTVIITLGEYFTCILFVSQQERDDGK